jgi:methylmalonyl-CoA mutase, N-terminal domain
MSISESKQAWEKAAEKSIAKAPERMNPFRNSSDIEVERCYSTEFEYPGYEEQLGFPGQYPYTRGVQPTMYRGRFWTMRQYAGFGNAKESNERYKYLLSAGQTGLSIAFDLPTQMGYDSDASMSRGEVGKVGVAIDSLADMEILFDGIPLDKVSTSMTINSTAAILLAMYIAVAEKQGVSSAQISGTIQNDILKEYMARGTYIYPPKESMRIITDIFAYCKDQVPKWNTISISGYHIREAGSSAVQEVAFTLADGIAYVEAAVKAGLDVDEFAPRLAFFFNAHNNLLEEVAKFRAARRMWSKIMRDRFGAKDPRSQMLRFHTQTAGCTLTAQQPDNNIMRVTLQALAAVLGGTQSLHTNSRDEALALPTEDSVRIALRTQQVIAYESGVADSVDPLAGSFLIESLTDQIEQQATAYIERIDALGGAVEAISRGFQQKEIQDSAYSYQRSIEQNETIIVGVNKFTIEEGAPQGLLRVKEEVEVNQKAALATMKAGRDSEKVQATLKALEQAAKGTDNLMPFILNAVESYATLGEIANVFRGVFGTHRETVVL